MAKAKFGNIIVEMRGKIAGNVYSRNAYGSYVRQKVSPINPQSAAQSLIRTRLATMAQAWRGLTQAQRDSWNSATSNFASTNIFGDQQIKTGFNLYGYLNRYRQEINQALLSAPPLPTDVPGITSLSLVADVSDDKIEATFSPAIDAGVSVIAYATPMLSAGINFAKSEYRKIEVLTSADVSPYDLKASWAAVFGATLTAGAKIFVKFKPVDTASGIAGTELSASAIITA